MTDVQTAKVNNFAVDAVLTGLDYTTPWLSLCG